MNDQQDISARIGIRIVELRKQKGIKQVDLAISAGIDDSSLRRIEEGKANPTVKTLAKIAKSLRVELVELFADQKDYPIDDGDLKYAEEHSGKTRDIDKSIEFLKSNGYLIFKSV